LSDQLLEHHSGNRRLADLGNAISDAAYKAIADGLAPDFVCSVLVGVAADYWLQAYDRPVTVLGDILVAKARAARAGGRG
jgi:hypothetical protein